MGYYRHRLYQPRIWWRHYWGGQDQYGPDGIEGPTKYTLILNLKIHFFHGKSKISVFKLKKKHFGACLINKMYFFFIFFFIFLLFLIIFSGFWARQNSGPDNLGGPWPPRPPHDIRPCFSLTNLVTKWIWQLYVSFKFCSQTKPTVIHNQVQPYFVF